MLKKVGIVVPVHNRRETTLQALSSLRRIRDTGLQVRIFVVDDGSTDGTSDAIRERFPDVVLLRGDGSLHYAAGTNRGIEASLEWGSDFVVTMNDDSIFHEDFLTSLVDTSDSFGGAIVGSLLLLWDQPHLAFQVAPKFQPRSGGWVFPQDLTAFSAGSKPFDVDCIVGNCVLFPAQAIRENGMLDEKNFPAGWGDAQFTTRLRKAGWRLVVDPGSKVWCEPNTYPPTLHNLPAKDRLKALLLDTSHPSNLGRQFRAVWHSAPSKLSALTAFFFFISQLFLKATRIIPFASRS